MRAALVVLLALVACKDEPKRRRASPGASAAAEAERAAEPQELPAQAAAEDDPSWLAGTWERQSAPKQWLLFNPPNGVALLEGKPVRVAGRGTFTAHGKFVSVILQQQERYLEAAPDHSHLVEGTAGGESVSWRRGSPPP